MSLAVVIKGPEGIVLAADSRITLRAQSQVSAEVIPVVFDNATKLLTFAGQPHVAAVTYGLAAIGQRTAHSLLPEFDVSMGASERMSVSDFASRLSRFYVEQWGKEVPDDYVGPDMTFLVGGYDEGAAYGSVFLFGVPSAPEPQPRNCGVNEFGMTWGGQLEVASRLVQGYDPQLMPFLQERLGLDEATLDEIRQSLAPRLEFQVPWPVLPLQDCVDLAVFLVRVTADYQRFSVGVRGVGGPTDVAVITRTKGVQSVKTKTLRVEGG
jgi:hypothetical protein